MYLDPNKARITQNLEVAGNLSVAGTMNFDGINTNDLNVGDTLNINFSDQSTPSRTNSTWINIATNAIDHKILFEHTGTTFKNFIRSEYAGGVNYMSFGTTDSANEETLDYFLYMTNNYVKLRKDAYMTQKTYIEDHMIISAGK